MQAAGQNHVWLAAEKNGKEVIPPVEIVRGWVALGDYDIHSLTSQAGWRESNVFEWKGPQVNVGLVLRGKKGTPVLNGWLCGLCRGE